MFKYKDKVLIIKDPENNGFFEGAEGVVMSREKNHSDVEETEITYGVDIMHYRGLLFCKEDEIQKI